MLAWVVYLFITKKARAGIGTLEYMTAMNLTAAATVLPLLVLFDRSSVLPPAGGWGWIVLLALVPGFLGHGLLTWAQPLVDLSVSSILLQAEPVSAAIAGRRLPRRDDRPDPGRRHGARRRLAGGPGPQLDGGQRGRAGRHLTGKPDLGSQRRR